MTSRAMLETNKTSNESILNEDTDFVGGIFTLWIIRHLFTVSRSQFSQSYSNFGKTWKGDSYGWPGSQWRRQKPAIGGIFKR